MGDIQSFSVSESTSPPNNRFTMKISSSILCFVIAAAVAKPYYGVVYPQFQKQLYPVPLRPLPFVQIVPQYRPVIHQCQTVRVIKYVAGYEKQCHNANTQKCNYQTEYKEECADKKQKVCQKFWEEDGYGGKVWTEDPTKCHWLKESECSRVPHPVKKCNNVVEKV